MALGSLFIYPTRGKFFIFMEGVSNSGKSVLGNFCQRLYPKESVSNIRLRTMKENFGLMRLLGAVINFELDMPNTKLNAEVVSRLKQITGGDSIDVPRKYLSSVTLERQIKFVFASNHPLCLDGEMMRLRSASYICRSTEPFRMISKTHIWVIKSGLSEMQLSQRHCIMHESSYSSTTSSRRFHRWTVRSTLCKTLLSRVPASLYRSLVSGVIRMW